MVYANARGIKSKIQSLKQIILSKPCHIFEITEKLLKNNGKVNIQHYKWVRFDRQNKEGVGIGFLINMSIIKSYAIQLNLNKIIEFMSIKINLTNNDQWRSMKVCVNYGKQESRSRKKESEKKINKIWTYIKSCIGSNTYVLVIGVLLKDIIKMQHLLLLNYCPCCVGKWTRVNTVTTMKNP